MRNVIIFAIKIEKYHFSYLLLNKVSPVSLKVTSTLLFSIEYTENF